MLIFCRVIVILFYASNILAQKSAPDTVQIEIKINELNHTLSEIQRKYKLISDSFDSEIVNFKVREDYFVVALEDQATRFSLIATVAIALLGIFSFIGFKVELYYLKDSLKKEIDSINNNFQDEANKVKILESEVRRTTANVYVAASMISLDKKKYYDAFWFSIYAARENSLKFLDSSVDESKMNKLTKSKIQDIDTIKINLENASSILDYLENSGRNFSDNEYNDFRECFDKIGKVNNEYIDFLVAGLRTRMRNLLKSKK